MRNLKIFTDNIEQEAIDQIHLLMAQEAFQNSIVRIMPDVHAGKGCVIGFTGDLGDKVIPNIVGVDIGCGMLCVSLGNKSMDLEKLDQIIHEKVPSGFHVHEGRNDRFPALLQLRSYRSLKDTRRFERSLGTLGGGNHFIEIDIDNEGNHYLIIHTGSRNLGKQVADYYQNLADQLCNYNLGEFHEKQRKLIDEYKAAGRKKEIQAALIQMKKAYQQNTECIPKDLAYLEGTYREDYLYDMKLCQEFAHKNRLCIARQILSAYFEEEDVQLIEEHDWGDAPASKSPMFCYFETIHNYISFKDHIVRKGAISARKNEKVLIPMNMRDGCIIGIGKGNEDWNNSAPHGAGRIMSRSKAKETLHLKEYKESMKGIYTTSLNEATIDEAPFVYKPMEEILSYIKDTVDIINIIHPIYNFKASD